MSAYEIEGCPLRICLAAAGVVFCQQLKNAFLIPEEKTYL